MRVERTSTGFANDIATAPGDLPMPDVIARYSALQWQFRHDNTISPLAPGPNHPVSVTASTGPDMPLERAVLLYTTDGSFPEAGAARVPMEPSEVEWSPHSQLLTFWRAEIPGQAAGTIVRYRLAGWRSGISGPTDREPDAWANDGQGFWFRFPGTEGITTFAYVAEPPRDPLPDWMRDTVVYHVFLDRFHPGSPDGGFENSRGPRERHGGTLAGVRQALPYIAGLGATCLWLSPLGPSETYHRYDTIDYFGIDPALGTAAELHRLVEDAHARGIRIWLDFVPSHASWHHPAFREAQRDRSAPTHSWFTFDEWPHAYRNFMQTSRYLPSLNTDDPGARAHLIEAAEFWIREFGVDGYRLDHAIAPSMDFWVALRTTLEAVKSDVVLVGEATDTPDCLRRYRGKLHGVLDFPLARALRLCFGAGSWDLAKLDRFLHAYTRYMLDGPGRISFLDNHDMDRFLWVAGNDTRRLKMAAVCQFTLEATPVVYYGTEVGMSQERGKDEIGPGGDAEARRDMLWEESSWNLDMLSFYRRLIQLRHSEPALRQAHRETVDLDTARQTYAYVQRASDDAPGATATLTAFNMSGDEQDIRLPIRDATHHPTCLLSTGDAPELRAGSEGTSIRLSPMSAAIVRLGGDA